VTCRRLILLAFGISGREDAAIHRPGAGSRSSRCPGRINMRSFLGSPLVVVGKGLELTRNRIVGHGSMDTLMRMQNSYDIARARRRAGKIKRLRATNCATGGEGVSQSPLKDKALSIFRDQNSPFELRPGGKFFQRLHFTLSALCMTGRDQPRVCS